MTVRIHPTAVVDPTAELADGVTVGPAAVVGPQVVVGAESEIGGGAHIQRSTRLGRRNRIYPHACLGFDPQDLKFAGEPVVLEVGDGNTFREFSTVHRGTAQGGGVTAVGSGNLFMAYSHVAHDCRVGDGTIFSNAATLAGHVEVADHAVIGAFSAVHQHCRVGPHAYIGGFSVITMDALPFARTVGAKPACYGLNRIGLVRKGVAEESLKGLEAAFRLLLRSGLNTTQAVERMRDELADDPRVSLLADFIAASRRGVIKRLPGRGGSRGGGAGGESG